jgi:mono/diheme cytochrome c family protein
MSHAVPSPPPAARPPSRALPPRAAAPALLLAAALAGAAPATAQQGPEARRPAAGAHAGQTKCVACHTTEGWSDVKFIHERTGFPLTGKHAAVTCRRCHPAGFDVPVARGCAGCHRDPHGGASGARCASCHDTDSWRSRFGPEAHRRTNFPLQGKHALIPCESCHGDRLDRAFARWTVDCGACHGADLARASASGVPHDGFPANCLECHGFWRWSPAGFSGHDTCFPIYSGNHAGIGCMRCHVTLPVPLAIRSCSAQPWPACTRCHSCASVQPQHQGVSGFSCVDLDRRCYQCHPFGVGEDGGGNLRLGR